MSLRKAIDKNKRRPRVSTIVTLKKHTDGFMIEFGTDLAKFIENVNVFFKILLELIENCAKFENQITSTTHEITEMC